MTKSRFIVMAAVLGAIGVFAIAGAQGQSSTTPATIASSPAFRPLSCIPARCPAGWASGDLKKGDVDIAMVGDSITENWRSCHAALWQACFGHGIFKALGAAIAPLVKQLIGYDMLAGTAPTSTPTPTSASPASGRAVQSTSARVREDGRAVRLRFEAGTSVGQPADLSLQDERLMCFSETHDVRTGK